MKWNSIAAVLISVFSFEMNSSAFADGSVTQLLKGKLDLKADTITLPLYQGALKDGRSVWYIVTDADSKVEAERLGVGYAPELMNAANAMGTRTAKWIDQKALVFDSGVIDFKPMRQLTPGDAPHAFPPKSFQAGSVADNNYSPFAVAMTKEGQAVYNAPMLAFNVDAKAVSFCDGNVDYSLVHDHVVNICPEKGEVTVRISHGFANGKSIVYLSFDANNPMAATMEASTFAPAIDALKNTGSSLSIFAAANGQTGAMNPQRQGFDSALSGDGSPLNVLDGLPDMANGYSPLWDLHLGAWTQNAIENGKNLRLTSAAKFYDAVHDALMTGPGGGTFGSTGILINCPIVAILP